MTALPMMQVTVKFYQAAVAVAHAHEKVQDSLIPLTGDQHDPMAVSRIRLINERAKLTKALDALNELVAE